MNKKILLIFPSYDPQNPYPDFYTDPMNRLPMGVLCLGSYLKKTGYDVSIIDGRTDFKDEIEKCILDEAKQASFIGFSIMTPQIRHGYYLTKIIKEKYPEKLVIWGGIHPTLYTEKTCADPNIDYVVFGEGETATVRLLDFLLNGNGDIENINNLSYKKNGKVCINKLEKPLDINELPDPDYSLIDFEKYNQYDFLHYDKRVKFNLIEILASRGCPYNCSFCATTLPAFKKWRPLNADRIINLIERGRKKYNANYIWFTDDFFFGDKKRVVKILEYLVDKDYDMPWEANSHVNLFRLFYTDSIMQLMKDSKCYAINLGIESGSNRVLKILRKGIAVSQVMNAVRRLKKYGIIPKCYFMTGIPGETKSEAVMTIQLMVEIQDEYRKSILNIPGLFRPYPGTSLYEECVKNGFREPDSLQDWYAYKYGYNYFIKAKDLPWLSNPQWYINISDYVFNLIHYRFNKNNKNYPFSRLIAGKIAEFRLKHNFWYFPYEGRINRLKKRLEKRPLLKKLIGRIT